MIDILEETKLKISKVLEKNDTIFDISINNLENELLEVKGILNKAQNRSTNICVGKEQTKCETIGLKSKGKPKLKCKVCKEIFKSTDDLNEHFEIELFCIICEKCNNGYYENNSENCIPDVEEHTTHE